jgi:flagellar biosynthesis component FlhA
MKMIKTFLKLSFTLGVFLLATQTQAQVQYAKATSPEAMANQQTKYEAKELKLDSKQAQDLGKINLFYAQKMIELRKQANSENTKDEVEALKRTHSQNIRSLIGSEKYQNYLALKKKESEAEKEAEKDAEKEDDK